ncbi:TetR/AcrR family transcriptional regulator [Mycolicibacterium neoaurum]|uniref:TetR/AcrR family transcriptional regulator n=1 Tax=Mycolicibacterium neoaurum TaxID=1795 RepID=UPI001BD0A0BA|nr:TetR/AcrR family transcriptional regulator [Mycolicibacterium neoaurum]QVI29840.1 TetR/AcrR family transcriptional regulator [Mycolicibacterium neoaurum]
MTDSDTEPAWKQRALERSLRPAKARASQRVERFLEAAQSIMAEKGSTDFTVQEVVDRSRQSLRSFYLQFDGKHELLLALFEDALDHLADQIRTAITGHTDPVQRLRIAVGLLFTSARSGAAAQRPLFSDVARRLSVSHPAGFMVAQAPVLNLLSDLMADAAAADRLRPFADPRRIARITMQTVMTFTQPGDGDTADDSISADEMWDFIAHGITNGG